MKAAKTFCIIFSLVALNVKAQSILARNISLNIGQQKLSAVLTAIGQKGGFRFSYNSSILPVDSLVSIHEDNLSVSELLDHLLKGGFEYRQSGSFVIIRYAPLEMVLLVEESIGTPDLYTIKGRLMDKATQKPVAQASVYEKRLLVSELSDENGHFSIRLKNITGPISLTITKENYKSTVTHFLAEVRISPKRAPENEQFLNRDLNGIEKTWLGSVLVTAGQKIQSINIGSFISRAPVQFSLVPGLNSHGSMSGQVVNRFSFNAIGAYSAGVDGGEIGLIFNIDKSNVRYFQFGGAFNLVGGAVRGVQIGGIFNYDTQQVSAVQVSLGYNHVGQDFTGFQVGGILNRVRADAEGVQLSLGLNDVAKSLKGIEIGTLNLVAEDTRGIQIGVGGNLVGGESSGLQIGGIANVNRSSRAVNIAVLANLAGRLSRGIQIGTVNYTQHLKGWQLGILNVSAKNEGYSVGLINVAINGYHKIALTANETTEMNLVYKSGSKKLYNMLMFGAGARSSRKVFTGGLGFGTELGLSGKLSINPELSGQYVYQGSWDYLNLLSKVELPLNIKLTRWLAIQGGPSLNIYYSKQGDKIGNFGLTQQKHRNISPRNSAYTGWVGWNLGLVAF